MSTTPATISIRHHSVEEVLDYLRKRIMGPEVTEKPIFFAGLIIDAIDCTDALDSLKRSMAPDEPEDPADAALAKYHIDLWSLNIAVYIDANYGSIFYDNAHIIAEIICLEATKHFNTQASIAVCENSSYGLYDSGTLVARLPLSDYIRRIWPNALPM